MVTALQEGDGTIHASWKDVADWSGVSYASVKRAASRLRELGWVKEQSGHRIVFDYRRSCPVEKAQIEPRPNIEEETLRDGYTHHNAPEPTKGKASELPPSGEDAALDEPEGKQKRTPGTFSAAVAVLVEAGADRAGAVKAVKTARKAGPLDLEAVRRIAAAVASLPSKPFRPGGLLCAAVSRPELGSKLIRDHVRALKRKASGDSEPMKTSTKPAGPGLRNVVQGDMAKRETPALSRWDAMRQTVRGWLDLVDLAEPEDLAHIRKLAGERGWSVAELRSLPELRMVNL
jgi:hypothetical protein